MLNHNAEENIPFIIEKLERIYAAHDYEGMTQDICQLFLIVQNSNNHLARVVAHYYLGIQQMELKHYKEGVHAMEIAVEVAEPYHLIEYVMRANNILGSIHTQLGNYYISLEYYLKVFYICKEHPEFKYETFVLNNLGSLFSEMEDYELALDYFTRAYSVCKQELPDRDDRLSYIVLNIMETLASMHMYEEVDCWYQNDEALLLAEDETLAKGLYLLNKAQLSHQTRQDYEAKQNLFEFVALTKDKEDVDYLFKSYIEVTDMLIEMEEETLANDAMQHAGKLQKYSNMKLHTISMNLLRIRFFTKFKKEEALQIELARYYELSQQFENDSKMVYKECLRLKINLEKIMFEQHQIMKQNEELQRSINLDPFTEIYNKVYVESLVNDYLHMNEQACSALLLLDIDLFKTINDTYGHSIGDYIIKESVKVLRNVLRGDDIIGRVGGDEFVIFLNNLYSIELVKEKASLILKQISQIYVREDGKDNITVSIGICINQGEKMIYQEMFCKADAALYEAKANGRNQFSLSD